MMRTTMYRWLGAAVLAASAAVSAWATDHAGDVAVLAREGQLKLGGQRVEIHASTGFNIYRADLGDLFHGPWATSNPGFQTQGSERLKPGVEIGFEGLGALSFWDGMRWSVAPHGTQLRVSDYLEAESIWTAAGVTHGTSQLLGETTASGKLHEHLVFSVTEGAALGAYQITLRLNSPDYLSSDPFYMVLNRGLDEAAFLRAREAFMQTSPVPEPASAGALALGLAALWASSWRRRVGPRATPSIRGWASQ
jgi:hypothetical protein